MVRARRMMSGVVASFIVAGSALLLAGPGHAAAETVTIVFDDANGFRPPSADIPYGGLVRWTNSGGTRVHIKSVSGPCNFDFSVDPFTTSAVVGPYTNPGRCSYTGETLLGSADATLNLQPAPRRSPTPTPTRSSTSTPTSMPTLAPTASPRPPATDGSPSPEPSGRPSDNPALTQGPETPSPAQPGETAPSPCPGCSLRLEAGDPGRRTLGLPATVAGVLLAALVGALVRVLAAQASQSQR